MHIRIYIYIYICIHTYMIYDLCIYLGPDLVRQQEVRGRARHARAYIYIYIYIHTYLCIFVYLYISLSLSLSIYLSISLSLYIYIYIYIYNCWRSLASFSILAGFTPSFQPYFAFPHSMHACMHAGGGVNND